MNLQLQKNTPEKSIEGKGPLSSRRQIGEALLFRPKKHKGPQL
jgi:hypothetical protein